MKQKVLVDVVVKCDPPSHIYRWARTVEQQAEMLEDWVKEFHDFIRDHRSQDPVYLNVERVYEDRCSFCNREWETEENGEPICCNEAVAEWTAQKENISA